MGRRIETLRHDPLGAEFAGLLEHARAVLGDVVAQQDVRHHRAKASPAQRERLIDVKRLPHPCQRGIATPTIVFISRAICYYILRYMIAAKNGMRP
jgi:hypothetical protein